MLNKLRQILPQPRGEEQGSSWAVAIMMFTHAINGLGCIWVGVLDSCVPDIYFQRTLGSENGQLIMVCAFTGMSYIVPILAGLYADTKGGRYETLLFGKVIKVTGTAMREIIIILLHFQKNIWAIESDILQGAYVVTVLFNYLGIWVVLLTTLVFGAMQVDHKDDAALTSYFRWSFCLYSVGMVTGSFVWIIMVTNDISRANSIMYYTSMILVTETLSVIVLVFGKGTYNRNNRKGCRSLREAMRIIKIHIFCKKVPMEDMAIIQEDPNVKMLTRRLERLMARKFILLTAFLAVGSTFQIIWFAMLYHQLNVYVLDDSGRMVSDVRGEYIRDAIYIMPVITVPVLEVIGRVTKCLRTEYTRALKIVGLGNFLSAVAVCIAGYLHQQIRKRGLEVVSMYWQLPAFIVVGIASVLFFPTVFEMSYRESLPGLGTLTTGLCLAFGYGLSTTVIFLFSSGQDDNVNPNETIHKGEENEMFGLAAGMVIFLIVLCLPISIWFTKVREDIKSTASELDEAAPHVDTSEGPAVRHDEICDVTLFDEESDVALLDEESESVNFARKDCELLVDLTNGEESLVK